MIKISMRDVLMVAGLLLFTFHISQLTANAQRRDFLTDAEIELVRDAQEIDRRIEVLVHAADRRFDLLKIDVSKPAGKKESETWGDLPKGERIDLLFDIKRLLQKAIDDIDNISERPDSAILPDPEIKKPKTLADIFPVAVRNLAAAASRYKPALQKELDSTTDQMQKGVILDSIDSCNAILESVTKLPAEVDKKKKKNN
ncbi:MAG: hypothetical protein KA956_05280 [Pyrinomonadaceae bacterium]|nr:hypothetical protein [Acidobacteriota bacterium]MBK7934643.1 hypothetical protein [Acidobacteriota bacterium]MBP7375867.1 hypothetical protein [Pyrinomonadaceae bacterium]